jgi:sulfur carrier protein
MNITINGETKAVATSISLTDLIASLDLTNHRVAIERNGAIVPRSQHAQTNLSEGDALEIVVAVGGG